jgi:hypothetical protein
MTPHTDTTRPFATPDEGRDDGCDLRESLFWPGAALDELLDFYGKLARGEALVMEEGEGG